MVHIKNTAYARKKLAELSVSRIDHSTDYKATNQHFIPWGHTSIHAYHWKGDYSTFHIQAQVAVTPLLNELIFCRKHGLEVVYTCDLGVRTDRREGRGWLSRLTSIFRS